MQFFKLLAVATTLAVASAKAIFTNVAADFVGITAGKPVTITWSGATGPVTISLKSGPSTAQVLVSTITTGQTGTSFSWTPATTLTDGTYNLEINDGTEPNYSIQFPITGGTGTATPSGSSTAASSASSSAATSASVSSTVSSAATTTSTSHSTSSSGSSSSSTKSSATSNAASSTSSAASVPTSNSAVQNGSPFALVMLGVLALVGMN